MRSAFFGLHIASSAMHAARGNLHTIAHNIANAETEGFSRQVAQQQASNPLRASFGRGMIGTGSVITGVIQIRNTFLDGKFRSQNAVLGQFSAKADILSLTQGILRDVPAHNVGLTTQINEIMERMSDLSTNAGDITYRRNFLSSLESLSLFLNTTQSQLTQQMVDINQEIRATVGSINALGHQITALNRQITLMELDGSNANDLRDQRNLLIDRLSRFVNIDVREIERNPEVAAGRELDPRESRLQMVILIDGAEFVNHFHMQELSVVQRVDQNGTNILMNPEEPPRMYDVVWGGGTPFNMHSQSLSGELAGLLQLRDGNGANHTAVVSHSPMAWPGPPAPTLPAGATAWYVSFDTNLRTDIGSTGIVTARHPDGRTVQIRYSAMSYAGGWPPTGAHLALNPDDLPDGWDPSWTLTIGETTSHMGIPYFKARLNELARTLARAFNEGRHLLNNDAIDGLNGGHLDGIDLNGDPGAILLTYIDALGNSQPWAAGFNYFNITATNFVVNPDLLRDPSLLALTTDDTDLPDGHDVIMGWLNLTDNRSLFREGRLGDFLSAITGDLGITSMRAVNFSRSYGDLLNTIDNQRFAVKGVSLDEEVTFMISHQLVFQAAARLLTIIDSIYDTTINRMGNW